MERQLIWVLATLCILGCKAPPPTLDPFLGRSTIPPPNTGEVGLPSVQIPAETGVAPTGTRRSGLSRRPDAQDQSGIGRSTERLVSLDGAPRRARISRNTLDDPNEPFDPFADEDPAEADPARDGIPDDNVAMDEDGQAEFEAAGYEAVIRIVEPQAGPEAQKDPAERSSSDGAKGLAQSDDSSSPQFASPARRARPRSKPSESSAQFVSNRRTTSQDPGASGDASEGTSRYGFESDYRRLRGRLEYSEGDARWKLRYLPIDSEEAGDSYGGSVVLSESALLDGFNPGDFVEIEGSVKGRAPGEAGFSPLYQVRAIRGE